MRRVPRNGHKRYVQCERMYLIFASIMFVLPFHMNNANANDCCRTATLPRPNVSTRGYCGWKADEIVVEPFPRNESKKVPLITLEEAKLLGKFGVYWIDGRWKEACHIRIPPRGRPLPSMAVLQKLPKLRSLYFYCNHERELDDIGRLTSLRALFFGCNETVPAEALQSISRLRDLQRLAIYGQFPAPSRPKYPGNPRTTCLLSRLPNCPKLSEVFLYDPICGPNDLKFAVRIPSLKRLHLQFPFKLKAPNRIDISPITSHRSLEQLILTNYEINAEQLASADRVPSLGQLTLSVCTLTSETLQQILTRIPLESLVLDNCTIIGSEPIDFSECKTLRELVVARTIDRQHDLMSIGKCQELRRLVTRDVAWSKEAMQSLQGASELKILSCWDNDLRLSDYTLPPALELLSTAFGPAHTEDELTRLVQRNNLKLLVITTRKKNYHDTPSPREINQTLIIHDLYTFLGDVRHRKKFHVGEPIKQLIRDHFDQCLTYSLEPGRDWLERQVQRDGTSVDKREYNEDYWQRFRMITEEPIGTIDPITGKPRATPLPQE